MALILNHQGTYYNKKYIGILTCCRESGKCNKLGRFSCLFHREISSKAEINIGDVLPDSN